MGEEGGGGVCTGEESEKFLASILGVTGSELHFWWGQVEPGRIYNTFENFYGWGRKNKI